MPIGGMFNQRASLEQSYDVGTQRPLRRSNLALGVMLDNPIGIGPAAVRPLLPEDPHNSYLNAFMSGGWLGGVAYLGCCCR